MESSSRFFCDSFIDNKINNKKGLTFSERFIDIISDPNNMAIKRVKDAGKVIDGNVIMHNGIKVSKYGYYGDYSDCLTLNFGCHEPSEERMFQEVLTDIKEGATMIELGSYWAFYTIWFQKKIKNAINYCIEPDPENIKVGIDNCKLNETKVDFTTGFIGRHHIKISEFVKEKNIDTIDILHSDIQGYELELLEDIEPLMKNKKIKYLFVSTHSNDIHLQCLKIIERCDYRVIASADFDNETFVCDGIIVCCPSDVKSLKYISLGNRAKTPLRTEPYDINYFKE